MAVKGTSCMDIFSPKIHIGVMVHYIGRQKRFKTQSYEVPWNGLCTLHWDAKTLLTSIIRGTMEWPLYITLGCKNASKLNHTRYPWNGLCTLHWDAKRFKTQSYEVSMEWPLYITLGGKTLLTSIIRGTMEWPLYITLGCKNASKLNHTRYHGMASVHYIGMQKRFKTQSYQVSSPHGMTFR